MGDSVECLKRAAALLANGDPGRAEAELAPLCARDPDNARAQFLHGVALHASGRIDEALAGFRRCLALEPGHVQALSASASLLHGLGRLAEAVTCLREALVLAPGDADLLVNLGILHDDLNRPDKALASYEAALQRVPQDLRALQNRAALLARARRFDQAVESLRTLVRHHPRHLDGYTSLGNLLLATGDFAAALAACEQAIAIDPESARAHADRALALASLGRFADYPAAARRAVQLEPGILRVADPETPEFPDPRLVYLLSGHRRLARCDWHDFERQCAVFTEVARDDGVRSAPDDQMGLLMNSYVLPVAPTDRARLARRCGARIAARSAPRIWRAGERRGDGRLRVAYVSADYRMHPGATLLLPVLAHHDRERFEISAYALNEDDGSEIRRQLAGAVDRFVDLSGLDAHESAWRIHDGGCDLLVFREGYTQGTRPGILAQHPAPVQITWAGYHGTLGGGLAHYHITDPVSNPPADAAPWDEARVFLPYGTFPFPHDHQPPPTAPARSTLGLPETGIVFGALHRGEKLDPALFACWMRLLDGLPDSVLWLLGTDPAMCRNLVAQAGTLGVDPARLRFAPRVDNDAFRARLAAADIWLDTRWYGSHTTLLEAFGAGVPAVTCPGNDVHGRQGQAMLIAAGLPELVCETLDEYRHTADALARDRMRRVAVREALLTRAAPLFDNRAYTRTLERAYEETWRRHLEGLPPADLSLDARAYGPATD